MAEKFAVAARLYAESAVCLATSGKSGIDFTRLSEQTIEAQGRAEAEFKIFREHVASHLCGEATQNGKGHPNAKEQRAAHRSGQEEAALLPQPSVSGENF